MCENTLKFPNFSIDFIHSSIHHESVLNSLTHIKCLYVEDCYLAKQGYQKKKKNKIKAIVPKRDDH